MICQADYFIKVELESPLILKLVTKLQNKYYHGYKLRAKTQVLCSNLASDTMHQYHVVQNVHCTCTIYTVHCTVYITLHNLQCALYTMYDVHCTVYTLQCTCTIYTVHCTVYITLHNLQCALYTMYDVHCTVYTLQSTVYNLKKVTKCRYNVIVTK